MYVYNELGDYDKAAELFDVGAATGFSDLAVRR